MVVANDELAVVRKAKISQAFSELEKPVMHFLLRKRTAYVFSKLCLLLLPVWDYYISYHLGRFRIYSKHKDYEELYHETYGYCLAVLGRVKAAGADFNRIKRYFNKSIDGYIFNKLFKKPKKDIEMTRDDLRLLLYPDSSNLYSLVDLTADLQKIEVHILVEFDNFFELCSALLGAQVYRERGLYEKKFRKDVYTAYKETGNLLAGGEIFKRRFGVLAGV